MRFIRDLLSGKSKNPTREVPAFEDVIQKAKSTVDEALDTPVVSEEAMPAPETGLLDATNDEIEQLAARVSAAAEVAPEKSAVNIWDLDDSGSAAIAAPKVEEAPAAAAPTTRRRRNKTRVLGFNGSENDVVSLFEDAPKALPSGRTQFPVGWILVDDGPGRGNCFTLEAGMSQIGRGEDQAIALDFGDNTISRTNHAAIVYDGETHSFTLGHGGKKNIVRLNGDPVVSNEVLSLGDKIKIGETTLHFVPLCSDEFNWSAESDSEENEDVAIA